MSASRRLLVTDVPTSSPMNIGPLDGDISGSSRQPPRRSSRSRSKPPADHQGAVKKLAALAQETRLAAFRLIIAGGENGCSAGSLADALGIPATTLSFHLASLVHAGLASQYRAGRQIIYTPVFEALDGLITYMIENCCAAESCRTSCADAQTSRQTLDRRDACKRKPQAGASHAPKRSRSAS